MLNHKSTSGIDFSSSSLYLFTKHPIATKYLQLDFLYSAISKIVFIASSFADAIKPQVFTIIISASSGSFTISNLCFFKTNIPISVSTKFLLHPNDIKPTFI